MTPLSIFQSEWFRRLLGLPPDTAKKIEQTRLAFATGWTFWAAAGLLVACLLWFGFCYWKDGTRPSWWLKGPLVLLRLLAVAALLVMLAQPTLRLRHADTVRPTVLLLVDASESMARPDLKLPARRAAVEAAGTGIAPDDVPRRDRLERANALLNEPGLLAELSKRYNVRAYSFASAPRPVPLPTDARKRQAYRFAIPPEAAGGDSTQMGAALRRALEDAAGQPLAGALVVSDGGSNLGEDPVTVAAGYRQANAPLSAVGLGDPTRTKDLALLSVLADDVVRANNTVNVYAALSHRGYAGRTMAVTLTRGGVAVEKRTLRLGPDEGKQEVKFTYAPTQAGRFDYTVTAQFQPGEVTRANNTRRFVQTVVTKKLRVLYVEGDPRYEFRYLNKAILRDNSLEFANLLTEADEVSQGGIPLREFPKTEKELFQYDIVMLGDVQRSYFTFGQLESLRRFVEDRGASLLVIAGERHMPHEYVGTPLEAVLPVTVTSSPDPILTDDEARWTLTPEGKRSPITMLEDSPTENERVWRELPGFFWAAGVPRAKPGATVLAVHSSRRNADGPYPLAVAQPFGAGKSFISLVDSTWRWRWRVGDRYFYRWWGQVLRTLTPKEIPGNSRFVQLNADRANYRLGEKVLLSARLLNEFYRPIKADRASATVKTETGQTQRVEMRAVPGSPGLFTGEFQPDRVGRWEAALTSPANPDARATAAFVVESLALERQKPELDEKLLRRVASAGGGKLYPPDKLRDWMKSLPYTPLTVRSEEEIELWDAPLFLVLFITPLGLEWLIRKRRGML